jgi:hypothetical protein
MIASQHGKDLPKLFFVLSGAGCKTKFCFWKEGIFHFGEGSFVFQGIFQFGWI